MPATGGNRSTTGTSGGSSQALAELQRVTDVALSHLALDDLLSELLDRIREILHADTAAILLMDEAAGMVRARAAKGIEEEVEQGVRIPLGKGFAGRIAAERRAVIIDDVDHADILNPILRQKGIRSLLGVPLLVEGRVLGVLHVGTLTPRKFTEHDRDLLQLAADRAALGIEHRQLYERERTARLRAERAQADMHAVQRVTDAALAYLPLDELLEELLERSRDLVSADTAAILLLDERAGVLRARAAKGIEEEVEQGVQIPLGRGFAGRIAAQREAVTIEDVDHADILNPILREKGIRSLLGVPLLVEGRVLGVLHVGTLRRRLFTEHDRDLLRLAADRAALAIERAQLYEARRLTTALQEALLPQELVRIPGLEVAARYLPAAQGSSLGGDWYDVFTVDHRRVGIAVGDVVGRGLPAAALMAQLRTALRAYAFEGHDPAVVVERLNRMLGHLQPAKMATAAYVELDPEEERVRVVSAGHPPPLVIDPDGRAHYLPVSGDVALGATRAWRYGEHEAALPAGSTLVLYTDGVVERRGESLDVGLERLRRIAERGLPDVEALCDAILEELLAGPSDDVAVLAARLVALGDRLVTTWPAQADVLSSIRQLLRRWLRHRGAGDDEIYDIVVACQEACANAVEHAYAPGDEAFSLDASVNAGTVEVTIRDHGRWRAPRGLHRGRGMPIMETLMDDVQIERTPQGTAVVLRRRLERDVAA